MKNWQFIITVGSLAIGIIAFVWGVLWMMMAKDLVDKTAIQEQELIQYKWELEQVPYICKGEEYEG
jgi:hypothetical protein